MKLLQISGKRVLHTFQHSNLEPLNPEAAGDGNVLDIVEEEDEGMDVESTLQSRGAQSVECIGFSPIDYKWIASGGLDNTLKIWDSISGSCRFFNQSYFSIIACD